MKDKIIEKQRELIDFYEKKLSVGEINSAYDFKKDLQSLQGEQEREELLSFVHPKDGVKEQSAEEILSEITGLSINYMFKMFPDKQVWSITPKTIIKAMEQYHNSKIRAKMIDFANYYMENGIWENDTTYEEDVDEYLKDN